MGTFTWGALGTLGKSRALNTSFLWLLIVPLAAKLIGALHDPALYNNGGLGVLARMELPFSWKLFYWSAALFAVGGVLYRLFCPRLIRDYSSYGEFRHDGRGAQYLLAYSESRTRNILTPMDRAMIAGNDPLTLGEFFWKVHDHEQTARFLIVLLCFACYAIGGLLIGIVAFQNLFYVVEVT